MNTSFALSLMGKFAKSRSTTNFRGTLYHGRKTIFSFSGRPEKMVFPKNSRWNMIFFVLSVKMISLFFENMILPLGWKMKDELSQESPRKFNIFFRCFEKMIFSKRPRQNIKFVYYLERWSLFLWKHNIFSFDRKRKIIFLKKYTEARYFLHTCPR